jgi:hypothetical protein
MDSIHKDLKSLVEEKLRTIEQELIELKAKSDNGLKDINDSTLKGSNQIIEEIGRLRQEQGEMSEKSNQNTGAIIKAMEENNSKTSVKFDEFSHLLRQNNTEALVEVMKHTTQQFNSQMSELINRLVKENFQELNNSVNNLNEWQKENKSQIANLTEQFIKTNEMFSISSSTLNVVAETTKTLVMDAGKLDILVRELNKVMIDDGKYQEITNTLAKTIDKLSQTTEEFQLSTIRLNDWVKTEKNFKESAEILINKLEEFRDINGDVWQQYRQEMGKAVSIIKETSISLNSDLEGINQSFYERLNDTLVNLDQCIQRITANRR